MDENRERAQGKLEEVGGAVKEKAGEWTGNERLEAEGTADRLGGESRQDFAKGVGQVKGAGEELVGNVKQGIGNLTGDDSLNAEGKADELKGEARREFNQ